MSPPRSSHWTLELQDSGHPANPAALVRETFDRLGLSSEARYLHPRMFTPLHHPALFQRAPCRPVESGASFSFELTNDLGAALVTKCETHIIDALVESAFRRYTKLHYESWVTFADEKDYGDDVRPVLVSGFDMTKDFAIVAYSNDDASLEADVTISVPSLASTSAGVWGTWRARCSPHTNHGPQEYSPLQSGRAIESPPQHAEAVNIPNGFNQCVFIRYYTMKPRKLFFPPKIIRAAAGPHDLGSGDSRGDAQVPELMVQVDMGGGEGLGEPQDHTMDGSSSDEMDVVTDSTPTVGLL